MIFDIMIGVVIFIPLTYYIITTGTNREKMDKLINI